MNASTQLHPEHMVLAAEKHQGHRKGRMPPPKGYFRKLISLPPALAARVRDYRFRRRLDNDTDAYRELIEKGLEAAKREEREEKERKS